MRFDDDVAKPFPQDRFKRSLQLGRRLNDVGHQSAHAMGGPRRAFAHDVLPLLARGPCMVFANPLHDGAHATLEALIPFLNLGQRLQARPPSVCLLAQGFEFDLAARDFAAQGGGLGFVLRLLLD